MNLSRRTLLAAATALPFAGAARAATPVSIRIDPSRRLRTIPSNYMGLGYEASSVATPGLLSADNRAYVQLVRNLGRDGVIRIGGNVSDFSIYDANGTSKWEPKDTVLTLANLRQLRGFLDATGWKLIWGLNLGGDKLDNAVEEAKAVAQVMGDKLIAMEVGNEPDLFTRSGHRSGNYDYQAWARDYRRYKSAVRAVLPRMPFAGPDIAFRTEWLESFARDEGGDIALLTAHHYIMGQADPATSIELMLAEEKKYQPALGKFQAAAQAAHVPWRMCETQSFSGGGRAGVSDTFASALWALDYLFVLAGYGCSGVNMETGVNHLGRISKYTPITDDLMGHYAPAPEYFGLLAFAHAARGEQIAATADTGGLNLTAYATRQDGKTVLTVINKDMTRDASVEITGAAAKRASVMRLTGPSLAATSGASLGGAATADDGTLTGGKSTPVRTQNGKALLDVPAGSAALVSLNA
ncbi:MAG: hypothetical protein H0U98_12360 [Alphaproteobacteria bacterium]|nr:hypothetical protein [Alphaproteobacteria bacterium]